MTLYLSSLNLLTIIQQVITKIFIIPLLIIFMKNPALSRCFFFGKGIDHKFQEHMYDVRNVHNLLSYGVVGKSVCRMWESCTLAFPCSVNGLFHDK